MTTLTEENITDIQQFSKFVQDIHRKFNNVLWYRGCGRYSWGLSPSLFRHSKTDIVELLELENQLMNRFKQRGYPFIQRVFADKWELLFFMQHYGVPTRLLDWSENPYVALYFALTSAPATVVNNNLVYSEDVSVWIFNPTMWNRHIFPQMGDDIDILSPINERQLEGYVPRENPRNDLQLIGDSPIAIYGTHNSQRIVAQRGVFTVFGKDRANMEDTYINRSFPQDAIIKLRFSKDAVGDLQRSLWAIGITDSVVFPDLDGLAKEIKRFFNFTV